MMKNNGIEILAPGGSLESMKAAAAAGADAVYMGGSRFGARAFADNPDEDGVIGAIRYLHLHGKKLYLTVNTLLRDEELDDLGSYLRPYYEEGLDAVLVQDMGVLRYIRRHFPELHVHASTQMTVMGPGFAGILRELGVTRIVPARELSLEEIRALCAAEGMEVECFVHGALCFSYSGQCLFSSMIGGRSGNRGRCAQTCRLPFARTGGRMTYPLSMKDLCTLDVLPEILDAGVCSLKIEGRMKGPRYTAGVVSIYRRYVDRYLERGAGKWTVSGEDRQHLLDLFDRGGQTDGYYHRHNGRSMVVFDGKPAFRAENREYMAWLDETYVNAPVKEDVTASFTARKGEPISLVLATEDGAVGRALGAAPEAAQSRPASREDMEKQIRKTGDTPFRVARTEIDAEDDLFLPVRTLNDMRREAVRKLEEDICRRYHRETPDLEEEAFPAEDGNREADGMAVSALFETPEQMEVLLGVREVGRLMPEGAAFPSKTWAKLCADAHREGKACYLALPSIWRADTEAYYAEHEKELRKAGFDGFLARNCEGLAFLGRFFPEAAVILDYNMYSMNRAAREEWRDMARMAGLVRPVAFTMPAELNFREMLAEGCGGCELQVYGRTPLMTTAQCMQKNFDRCTRVPGTTVLEDRKGMHFPVRNYCLFCYNVILNALPLSLHGEGENIRRLAPACIRLHFTTEDADETRRWTARVLSGILPEREDAPQGLADAAGEYTRGHFRRGVE